MTTPTPDEPFTWTDRQVAAAAGYVFTVLLLGCVAGIARMFNETHIVHRAKHPLRLLRR